MRWTAAVEPATRSDARDLPEARTLSGAARIFLRFGSPRLLVAYVLLLATVRLSLGGFGWGDLAIALAVAVYWPLQEWFAHMVILHIKPRTVWGRRIDPHFARCHRWHHRHPTVIERIFVPLHVELLITPVMGGFFWWVMPTAPLAVSGMLFFTAATLLYEWVHFSAHIPYAPKTAWFRAIKRHHSLHHFKNEHHWHAFTVPWIDHWMGTAPRDPREADRSPTVRTLGVDDPF